MALLAWSAVAQNAIHGMKGWLIGASQLSKQPAAALKTAGMKQMVIAIDTSPTSDQLQHIELIKKSGLDVWYWIEIARDEKLATEHPEWMSSIQGHPEWRRFHQGFPQEKQQEVVKVFPWVPIYYEGAFEAHLQKVRRLLKAWPKPTGIFLNDLQGAPTACGCGHLLCRWTTDYGPKKTAANIGHDAAARFIRNIRETYPDVASIPVWATECEAHDKDGMCAGVGCYQGACWREWSKQLAPLARTTSHLGVLLTYKELKRDLPIYPETAGWIPKAIEAFDNESTRFDHGPVTPDHLIGILQGWNVTPAEEAAQIRHLEQSGAQGYILSKIRISSDWEPRILQMDNIP